MARVFLYICLVVTLAAGATGAATRGGAEPAAGFYEDALARFNKGEYKAAIIQLKNAIQKDPKDLAARILIARAYLKLENGASAEKELSLARRHGADESFFLVPLGRAYLLQGKYDKVLDRLRTGSGDHDREADILILRGQAHLAKRSLGLADGAFAKAIRLRADEAAPYLGQARVRLGRGETAAAGEKAAKARSLELKNAEAWFISGEVQRVSRDRKAARASYNKAIGLESGYIPARLSRAGVLIDMGHPQDAIADIEFVRGKSPNNPRAAYFHAIVLAQSGDMKAAKQVLQDAGQLIGKLPPAFVRNDPPTLLLSGVVNYFRKKFETAYKDLDRYVGRQPYHPGARKLLGSLMLRKGEAQQAIGVLEPALRMMPDDPEIMAMLADALMKMGRFKTATTLYEKAVKLAPDAATFRTKLAMTRLLSGDQDQAVRDLHSALTIKPGESTAGALLSLIHLRNGEYDAALKTATALSKADPRNPHPLNMAGGAQLGLGDAAGARKNFARVVKMFPKYLPSRFNLAKLDTRQGKLEAAKTGYQEILGIDGKNTAAMVALSRIAERQRQPDEAIRWLEKVRSVQPGMARPGLRLVELYLSVKRPENALQVARGLRELDPKSLPFLAAVGRSELAARRIEKAAILFRQLAERAGATKSAVWLHRAARLQRLAKDDDGATASLEKAIAVDAAYGPAQIAMFELELSNGRLDAARARATALSTSQPESAIAHVLTGDLAMREKQFAKAADSYQAGLDRQPGAALTIRVYNARRAAGRDALGFIEGWAESHPRERAAQRALAAAYMHAGQQDAAIKAHEKLVRVLGDDPALLNNLALLYVGRDDPRALAYAEKAYKAAPDSAATMDTLGWVLVQGGKPAAGLKMLRNAQIRAPNVAEIHYHIGVAQSRMGQTRDAKRALRRALRLNGKFDGAAEAHPLLRKLSGG